MAEAGSRTSVGIWQPAAERVVLPLLPTWTGALLVFVWCAWASTSLARTVGRARDARAAPNARSDRSPRRAKPGSRRGSRFAARSRRAAAGVSDDVRAAAVLGLTSPSIVVAPVALGALNDEELDQIVVHEWAHVHRRDDIARLVQRVIVAFAGLHPAVWWIDRQLHLERETACDDWAVNATGSARALAVSLTKLASLPGRPSDAVSAAGGARVLRIDDAGRPAARQAPQHVNGADARRAPMIVAPMLGALALTVASVELVVTSPGVLRTSRSAARCALAPASASPSDRRVPSPPEPPAVSSASARSAAEGPSCGSTRQRCRASSPWRRRPRQKAHERLSLRA